MHDYQEGADANNRRFDLAMAGTLLVVLAATVIPRLSVLGELPCTDEGMYIHQAQAGFFRLMTGHDLTDGRLSLYPLLLSWLFALPGNHFVYLRLADLLVAAVASWLFCGVMRKECGSTGGGLVLSFLFLLTLNSEVFIQYGIRNSIFAAYVPLFLAMSLSYRPVASVGKWYWIGGLLMLMVLLRETFIPFLLVGLTAVLWTGGRQARLCFAAGAASAVFAVLLIFVATRGEVGLLYQSYAEWSKIYGALSELRASLLKSSSLAAFQAAQVVIGIAGAGVVLIIAGRFFIHRPLDRRRLGFWLAVLLLPLIEPVAKIGFPLHFAVCLLGLAGLTALAWKYGIAERATTVKCCVIACLLAVAAPMLLERYRGLCAHAPTSYLALQSLATGTWKQEFVDRSMYLTVARAISQASAPHGTLVVDGFMHGLYPLTGMLPPSKDLHDLFFSLCFLDGNANSLQRLITRTPPDILMITNRRDLPGRLDTRRAVEATGLYEKYKDIPFTGGMHYGNFDGTIYRRVRASSASK